MSRRKIGISPQSEVVDRLDDLVDECEDLRVSRSELIEAILVAYFEILRANPSALGSLMK